MKISKLNKIIKTGFFLLFLFLAFFSLSEKSNWFGLNLYFRTNPLDWLIVFISNRALNFKYFFPSIIFILLTFVFGRFFCGYVCPLGNLIDISDWIWIKRLRKSVKIPRFVFALRWINLLVLIGASIYGVSLLFLIEPMSLITRFMTTSVTGPLKHLAKSMQDWLSFMLPEKWTLLNIDVPYYHLAVYNLAAIIIIILLSLLAERFWCRYLCPLGLLYELMAKFSLFRMKVVENCPHCKVCMKNCPVANDRTSQEEIPHEECILCFNCIDSCPTKGISYKFMPGIDKKRLRPNYGLERRDCILYAGVGFAIAWISKGDASSNFRKIVRPPGAIPEKEFLEKCIRCGACMKACPSHCLQPAFLQEGIPAMGTPFIDGYIAGCTPECNLCGQVCPTGALRKLPLEEKQFAKMGMVEVDKSRCLAWAHGKECLMCDEICPYNAIYRDTEIIDGKSVPVFHVVEDVCMGCGLCAAKCAKDGARALKLYPLGELRKSKGSYITKHVKDLREKINDMDNFSAKQDDKSPQQKTNTDNLFQEVPEDLK
ncbi:MAG: 4Fe-4S binding protein [Candidatus Coatesbacteria bacterium]|nr:4Fe-4S binding protein [Candidatus Coatesbacteria bacterium]